MITAIETILKTGSISRVFPKGNNQVNPNPPYVILWGPELISQIGESNRGLDVYYISAHFNPGYTDDLDDYIYNEIRELLSGQILTTRDLRSLKVHFEGAPSDIIDNADSTISKEQKISTVGIYGG